MQEFLLYRYRVSGEITKEIVSVSLFSCNRNLVCQVCASTPLCVNKVQRHFLRSFGVSGVCKYFFVFQESLKTLPKQFWLKKTQKNIFRFSKCSNLKSKRYVGFVSKRKGIHAWQIFLVKITTGIFCVILSSYF